MKIAIYGQEFKDSFIPGIREFFQIMQARGAELSVDQDFATYTRQRAGIDLGTCTTYRGHKQVGKDTDYMISIGGDGTFLQAVTLVRDKGIPLVGINSGRLGFLSNIAQEDIAPALEKLFEKDYSIEHRELIRLRSKQKLFGDFPYALNELSIHRKDSAAMMTIHAHLDGEFLNTYWADGLIISTPTGSTAYSMSVGGPIITPNTRDLIVNPIAPHNLTVRPMVIPNESTITLKLEGRSENYLISMDSRYEYINNEIEISIEKAKFRLKLIKLPGTSFFTTLRNKLMWGTDKRS